jgi:hypothetical protein
VKVLLILFELVSGSSKPLLALQLQPNREGANLWLVPAREGDLAKDGKTIEGRRESAQVEERQRLKLAAGDQNPAGGIDREPLRAALLGIDLPATEERFLHRDSRKDRVVVASPVPIWLMVDVNVGSSGIGHNDKLAIVAEANAMGIGESAQHSLRIGVR